MILPLNTLPEGDVSGEYICNLEVTATVTCYTMVCDGALLPLLVPASDRLQIQHDVVNSTCMLLHCVPTLT